RAPFPRCRGRSTPPALPRRYPSEREGEYHQREARKHRLIRLRALSCDRRHHTRRETPRTTRFLREGARGRPGEEPGLESPGEPPGERFERGDDADRFRDKDRLSAFSTPASRRFRWIPMQAARDARRV